MSNDPQPYESPSVEEIGDGQFPISTLSGLSGVPK
jgi:hypothetical protein